MDSVSSASAPVWRPGVQRWGRTTDRPLGSSGRDRTVYFVVASAAVHMLAVLAFPAQKARADHPPRAVTQIEVALGPVETPPQAMPLGRLDAPLESRTSPQVRRENLPTKVATAASADPSAAPPAQAAGPEVLSSDNPYGQSSFTHFTAGRGATGPKRTTARTSAPRSPGVGFGVDSGSAQATETSREALKSWYTRVRQELASKGVRSYPRRARLLQQEGTSRISVTIAPDGRILAARLSTGSGHGLLDQAAVTGISAVGQVTAPPAGIDAAQELVVPVTFRLN